ncbi:MAG: DNA polymerase I [Bacteroidota bacterium]|jgi:DNA polymerase-1
MSEKKLFLLDAMALVYRAYYALIRSPRITSTGKNTNAQFGFTTTLLDLIQKEQPTHLAVVFDTHAPTERHVDFTAYKANRQETPEDILSAIPDIKRIVKGFNLPCLELDGFEADDIIGSLAKETAALGYTVYMVTPDKDYGQVVGDSIFIYKPGYQGGKAEILGAKEVCEKWGIQRTDQVIDILGLMGDAVDNIPGIPGVGEKTAAKLLAEYDTLENVLENADKIKGALGEKVRNGKESAILSKKLATIITNVPVPFHEGDFRVEAYNHELLEQVFNELEFRALGKRVLGADYQAPAPAAPALATDLFGNPIVQKTKPSIAETPSSDLEEMAIPEERIVAQHNITNTDHHYMLMDTKEAILQLVKEAIQQKEICIDTETTSLDAHTASLVGISLCWQKGTAYYIPFDADPQATKERVALLQDLFNTTTICWIGHNIKYDLLVLHYHGIRLKGSLYDTLLAHYVIAPEGKRSMDLLSAQYLGYQPVSIETLIGKKGKGQLSMRDVAMEAVKEYAAEDADITLQLKHTLDPQLDTLQVRAVYEQAEAPLLPVLTDMEIEGVGIDVDFLNNYSKELAIEIKATEEKVHAAAGVPFNLASPKQLGEVLFDIMKLDPSAKKTKTGQYATGEDVLLKLQHKHEIVDAILIHRELSKLKNTYVDALPLLIHPVSKRLHTSFNQAVAVTGRLSSNNPNLQNIPIRTERGREIRKAFVSRNADWCIVSADYSQIELRIIAALSGDASMIQAFKDQKDIHIATAAKVYGVEEAAVTKDMRRNAKAVNFGIIYGQSAFGLAENLGISRTEAKTIIENYFAQYPAIKTYMDANVQFAKQHGYVATILGRKRWLSDINSSNQTVRGFAERNAINAPIQGSAADMIKLAMIEVDKQLRAQQLKSKMVLQVHDELVFDAPKEEVDTLKTLITQAMSAAMLLPNEVPVLVETGVGNNWLEAH